MIAQPRCWTTPRTFRDSEASTITAHVVATVTHNEKQCLQRCTKHGISGLIHAVYFYLAHSHEKQPYAAMYGTQTSAVVEGATSPDFSKRKLLMDLLETKAAPEAAERFLSHAILKALSLLLLSRKSQNTTCLSPQQPHGQPLEALPPKSTPVCL